MATKNTGINQKLEPSETLAEITGSKPISRGDMMKKIWAYIKENDLQDPSDKRVILCGKDPLLKALLGSGKISMFQMTAKLSKHLSPIE